MTTAITPTPTTSTVAITNAVAGATTTTITNAVVAAATATATAAATTTTAMQLLLLLPPLPLQGPLLSTTSAAAATASIAACKSTPSGCRCPPPPPPLLNWLQLRAMDGGGASELAAGGSEPAPCSPASRMVARVLWDADATGGTRSDGADNSRSDCGCNSRKEESDCHLRREDTSLIFHPSGNPISCAMFGSSFFGTKVASPLSRSAGLRWRTQSCPIPRDGVRSWRCLGSGRAALQTGPWRAAWSSRPCCSSRGCWTSPTS